MSLTSQRTAPRLRYQPAAYRFVSAALRYTQQQLNQPADLSPDDEEAHISGQELLDGIRCLGTKQFGLLAGVVFRSWGVQTTEDFGRIVFELIDQGDMRKSDRDQLSDFFDVYDFDQVFDREYKIDVSQAFRN